MYTGVMKETEIPPETDDTMDDSSCYLTVRDVIDLLHSRYVIITGGKTREGYPIVTFPDTGSFCSLSDDDYRKLMVYLTSVPSPFMKGDCIQYPSDRRLISSRMQDADLGFVVIVDRRNDKWSSVKTVLLKISGYFPGNVHVVFVLRPLGFFQKAISEVSNKFFKEEFRFKLVICSCLEELHEHINPTLLTEDLGGTIPYNHEDWIEQRLAVEKFSSNLQEISLALKEMKRSLRETELPNDVGSTMALLENQCGEYRELKDDIRNASKHGESLLNCIRRPSLDNYLVLDRYPDRLINVSAVERLLDQLEDVEKDFDLFWTEHERKLSQCLELRKFEHEFKELQVALASSMRELCDMPETGETVAQVESILADLEIFQLQTEEELEKAESLQKMGKELIIANHYAVDSIAPKCVELERMVCNIRQKVSRQFEVLQKHKDLQKRIEKANKWCGKGVDLLASQQIEKYSSSSAAEIALQEVEEFLDSSNEFHLNSPREFHALFQNTITPESRALVQQVLKRIEDVQMMCEKRRASLHNLVSRPTCPVQAVVPEPAVPQFNSLARSSFVSKRSPDASRRLLRKAKTVPKLKIEVRLGQNVAAEDSNFLHPPSESWSSESRSPSPRNNIEIMKDKRGHVMTELIETEKAYVSELTSIIQGYKYQMDSPAMRDLVPSAFYGKTEVLFGNIEDLCQFHKDVFLRDLQQYSNTPELVGGCFVQRRETFHKLYSTYCLNKPKSEALRRQCGDDNPFFKECQKNLGHKLPLGAYLLKPVQRITKYQLLLKDLLKYSEEGPGQNELQESVDAMLGVLKYVNDSMHQIAITGFHGSLADYGKLLLQSSFNVWMERKKKEKIRELRFKPRQRYIFLYEQLVLFTKKYGREDNPSYAFKNALKTSQIGLTENVRGSRGDRRKFEVWLHGRTQVFIIQAPSLEIKETWVKEIKKVLLQQFENLKDASMKQYSDKIQTLSLINGVKIDSPVVLHSRRPELGRRASLPSLRRYRNENISSATYSDSHDDGWSTDEMSQTEDEDDDSDIFAYTTEVGGRYVALGDYEAVDVGEATLKEGEVIQVEKVGCAGWWYVRVTGTGNRGWVPASYLGPLNGRGPSSPSLSSQDSATGVVYPIASIASSISCHDGTTA
ncbi:guanine nucleotide exchange factor DBS-like isoform X3 [Centruroides vittatus]|uniref:guanine nucleotide exchange factor DBS-like isoform X3 n=1 Tax=Centruroides vittatus TaxID=120091 RepID=UPI003510921D